MKTGTRGRPTAKSQIADLVDLLEEIHDATPIQAEPDVTDVLDVFAVGKRKGLRIAIAHLKQLRI